MADTDFFTTTEEAKSEETPQEPEKVKVGDKEYTQEELTKLVGLGEIGAEAEERYNVKIDKVWPNFQATINEKKALEEKLTQAEAAKAPKPEGAEPTPEEIKAQAKKEAKALDLVTTDDINDYIDRRIEAIELKKDVDSLVGDAEEKYGIKTSPDAIINHMVETGIRNPEKAFKDLYEDKIDAWKEKQIESLKKPGMVTEDTSSAGSKTPTTEPVTRDNIHARIAEVLGRES